jgi:hypothetical protein
MGVITAGAGHAALAAVETFAFALPSLFGSAEERGVERLSGETMKPVVIVIVEVDLPVSAPAAV